MGVKTKIRKKIVDEERGIKMMKKMILAIVAVALAIFLGACNPDNDIKTVDAKNTIQQAKLTEREKGILHTTSNQSFVHEYKVDSSYKQLEIWAEKYELGKLANNEIVRMISEIKDKGSIIFTTSKLNEETNETIFSTSINFKGSMLSGKGSDTLKKGLVSSVKGSNEEQDIPASGEVVFGYIAYSEKGNLKSLSSDFYQDIENHLDELKDYDAVYLFRGKFTK